MDRENAIVAGRANVRRYSTEIIQLEVTEGNAAFKLINYIIGVHT